MKRLRIYADTSVFGGCFDDEFAEESKAFFGDIKRGKFVLVVSTNLLNGYKAILIYSPREVVEL